MTLRGMLGGFSDKPGYRGLEKALKIELLQSTMIWNSLLIPGLHGEGLRQDVSKLMDNIKEEFRKYSDREFIYFVATRPRVRVFRKPKYAWFSKNVILSLEFGVTHIRRRIELTPSDLSKLGLNGKLTFGWTPTLITFTQSNGKGVCIPIHSLLDALDVSLGIHSRVTYVGRTNDPGRRVVDGNHRGLSDTLTLANESGDDVFIFSNVFHGRHHSETADGGIQFVVSNSLIDEIDMKNEADLLEKLLIFYFNPITQREERRRDMATLRNLLERIRKEKNIATAEISFACASPNEYFRFGSDAIQAKGEHLFVVRASDLPA